LPDLTEAFAAMTITKQKGINRRIGLTLAVVAAVFYLGVIARVVLLGW
jgi:hypothetical protein